MKRTQNAVQWTAKTGELPPAGDEKSAKLRARIELALAAADRGDYAATQRALSIASKLADMLAYSNRQGRYVEIGTNCPAGDVTIDRGLDSPAGAGYDVEADRG